MRNKDIVKFIFLGIYLVGVIFAWADVVYMFYG